MPSDSATFLSFLFVFFKFFFLDRVRKGRYHMMHTKSPQHMSVLHATTNTLCMQGLWYILDILKCQSLKAKCMKQFEGQVHETTRAWEICFLQIVDSEVMKRKLCELKGQDCYYAKQRCMWLKRCYHLLVTEVLLLKVYI